MSRYHRQTVLPQIGLAGQARLRDSRVLLVGCGALGTTLAELLVRAGVGFLRVVDRDVVELTNLQRQVLFDENDAAEGCPKAVAAARRLSRVNSEVTIDPIVADVDAGNLEALAGLAGSEAPGGGAMDLLLDGTDNAEARYLMNDVAVRHAVPWVYGACAGVEGRAMAVRPGQTPCLRCIFPNPPGPGELPTCDTAGVLGPAASLVASVQATMAIQLLVKDPPPSALLRFDLWRGRFAATSTGDARRGDCPACGRREFPFLEAASVSGSSTSLCGRNAVQVRTAARALIDLDRLAERLSTVATVQRTPYLLKCDLPEDPAVQLTVFPDGRALVQGTNDPVRARSLYAKWIGM